MKMVRACERAIVVVVVEQVTKKGDARVTRGLRRFVRFSSFFFRFSFLLIPPFYFIFFFLLLPFSFSSFFRFFVFTHVFSATRDRPQARGKYS